MYKMIKTAALSAMLGLGALAAVPATAQADSFHFSFGGHGGPRGSVHIGDGHRDYRDYRRHDRHVRGCSNERALNKAARMGIRYARVVDSDRRTVDVRGRRHGDRVTVTFARSPSCPVVRW